MILFTQQTFVTIPHAPTENKKPAEEMTAAKTKNTKHWRYPEATETYVAAYGSETRPGSDLPSDSRTHWRKKKSLKSIPAHGCFREYTLTFSQGDKKS